MIYVDALHHYPDCGLPYTYWCHMATDGHLQELHAMAARLGLKRAWFQNKPSHPHYDLVPSKRVLALQLGAQAVDTMEMIRRCFPRPNGEQRGIDPCLSAATPEKGAPCMHERGTAVLLAALLQRDTVKALSMTDPWGSLVALGAKRIETRSWPTAHRGPLAIHIAKTLPAWASECCDEPLFRQTLLAGGYHSSPEAESNPWGLPLGRVVAVAWLDEVERITSTFQVDEPERSFGQYTPGRYAWRFSSVYRLETTVPARGSLGVWEWQPPASFWSEIQAAYDCLREEVQR